MFTVRFPDGDGWLEFSQPHEVLRASGPQDAFAVLDRADEALAGGAWIAGIVPYSFAGTAIGIFNPPQHRRADALQPWALSPLLPAASRERYDRAIASIARAIYDGDVYQVNFTVPFDLAIDGDPFSLWYDIARATRAPFQAYLADGDRRVLSWSPELFLSFDGGRVTAKPMKGTAPLDDTTRLHDGKNQAEHVMIVDLLRNDLRRVCDAVDVPALATIERYPTFATMTSTIEGRLRAGATLGEIFRAAFPCGSVTGAPKRAAMGAIERLESRERAAYCGSLGFLSPERSGWWNVAIRTAQLDGTTGRFDAGGGIVADSTPDDEWHELLLKTAFLRSHAQALELLETFSGEADETTLDLHLQRVVASAQRAGIAVDPDAIRDRMIRSLRPGTIVRMRVAASGAIRTRHDPFETPKEPVRLCLSGVRVARGDPWLQIKSSWRPAYERAAREAREHGCFDALLRNAEDELTEGSRTNLFVELDGTLYTPPLESGLLPGILRSKMLAQGRARERVLHAGDLHRARAIYVGNSARGLLRAQFEESGVR